MQKLDAVEDLRVRRTRKLLQQAMIESAMEKGFTALTVRDITERAMVNRSTFYRHYVDKYDLLEQHMKDIYALVEEPGGLIAPGDHKGLIELLRHMQQFSDFYRVVLGPQAEALLGRHFRQQAEQRFLPCFQHAFPEAVAHPDGLPLDLKFNAVASAGCGALAWWLDQERPSSPEQFGRWLYQLIYDIAASAFKPRQGPADDRKNRTLP